MQTFPDMPDGRDWIDCSVEEYAERRNGERAWWDPRDSEWKGGDYPRTAADMQAGRPSSLNRPTVMLRPRDTTLVLTDEQWSLLGLLHREDKSIYEPVPGNTRRLSDLDENHQKVGITCDSRIIYALLSGRLVECYMAREGFYLWRITGHGRLAFMELIEGAQDGQG